MREEERAIKLSEFTKELITYGLSQHEAGTPVGGVCGQLFVS